MMRHNQVPGGTPGREGAPGKKAKWFRSRLVLVKAAHLQEDLRSWGVKSSFTKNLCFRFSAS